MTWALPLAALFIAGASLVVSTYLSARSLGRSASAEYVDQLEKRVAECERDRIELRRELRQLRERELDLLQRLVRVEERS